MHPADDPHSIGSLLVEAGLVTKAQLAEALRIKNALKHIRLGEVFTRIADLNPHIPKLTEQQIELVLARQDHGRSGLSARAKADAAIRALEAANAANAASVRLLTAGAESARKITLNEDVEEEQANE